MRPRCGFPAFLDKTLKENPTKGEYFLPSVVTQLLEEKKARVKVLRSGDKWYGVTYKEDKPVVVAAIAEKTAAGLYPDQALGGVIMAQAEQFLQDALACL